ncbi:MAG: PhoU domain-containing protein [Thermoplasmata archaeon]|jgi:phosphate transport system protein
MTDGEAKESVVYGDPDRAIARLKNHVAEMSTLAVSMVAEGTIAMLDSDRVRMESVIAKDPLLDRFDIDIEAETMRLIAKLQPEGVYLRTLGAVLKIANCIDRVGRLGYDLARNLRDSPPIPDPKPVELLREMDARTRAMVEQAVDAFVRGDADSEKQIFAMDDDVDRIHHELQNRLIELLQAGGLPTERLALALLAGRHLERVGDNACKIAEKSVYAITGERRPEYFPRLAHRVTWGSEPPPSP